MRHVTFNRKSHKITGVRGFKAFFFPPSLWFDHLYLVLCKTVFLLMIANNSRCQESTGVHYHPGILLSAHLHPKGMSVFPQVTVWSPCACERDKMREDINTAGDGLHLSTVHGACSSPDPIVHPYAEQKKEKSASAWCYSNIFSLSFFPSFNLKVLCVWS